MNWLMKKIFPEKVILEYLKSENIQWPHEAMNRILYHCPNISIGEHPSTYVKKISDKLDEYENALSKKDDATMMIFANTRIVHIPYSDVVYDGVSKDSYSIIQKYKQENESVVIFGNMQNRAGYILVLDGKK